MAILSGMRGGGAQVTTHLLAEWTDPDTAMEAVGNSLGRFDHGPSAISVLHGDTNLRAELYGVLQRLVDGGALETRALADGRLAFRWCPEVGAAPATANGLVGAMRRPWPRRRRLRPPLPAPEPESERAPEPAAVPSAAETFWRRAAAAAPLLPLTVSCVIVLLAFVWLDQSVALLIAAAMAVVGVIGVIRRVQLAAFWTVGLVIAGLLLRFS
jgi:hypothetical protein